LVPGLRPLNWLLHWLVVHSASLMASDGASRSCRGSAKHGAGQPVPKLLQLGPTLAKL
jgi:hypothetical protein